jgi:hypothetical protein
VIFVRSFVLNKSLCFHKFLGIFPTGFSKLVTRFVPGQVWAGCCSWIHAHVSSLWNLDLVGLLGGSPPACYDSSLCAKLYKFVSGLLGCLCAELSLKATRSTVLFSCRSSSSAGGGGKQLITRVVCRKIEGEEEEFWSL